MKLFFENKNFGIFSFILILYPLHANEGSNLEKKVCDDRDWSGFLLKATFIGGNFPKENTRKKTKNLEKENTKVEKKQIIRNTRKK